MHRIVSSVAKKMSLPNWWVESIAIEYTSCRDFASRNEIWTFNFDKVSQIELEEAVSTNHVVVRNPIFHNVNSAVVGHRSIQNLFGGIPIPLCQDSDDIIAEGPVSKYHFLFEANPIDVWDPKLDFSNHFQVYDENTIWQWRIADFVPVEGRHYGKIISSEVDLEPLEEVRKKLAELRNPVIKPGDPNHTYYKQKVERFYRWLDGVRRPILNNLWEVHCKKKKECDHSKVTNVVPPFLSHFETTMVDQGAIWTRFSAAPIFFRATVEHVMEAEKLTLLSRGPMEIVDKLDKIYQERASAIIFASSCLEAFINGLYVEHFPKIWKNIEQISLVSKWALFLELKGKGYEFENSRQPFQTLTRLVHSRNSLVHYKNSFQKVQVRNGQSITHTESTDLPRELVREIPKRIQELIENLCKLTNIIAPAWIYPHVGWCAELSDKPK